MNILYLLIPLGLILLAAAIAAPRRIRSANRRPYSTGGQHASSFTKRKQHPAMACTQRRVLAWGRLYFVLGLLYSCARPLKRCLEPCLERP